jgi:hypothetical protein
MVVFKLIISYIDEYLFKSISIIYTCKLFEYIEHSHVSTKLATKIKLCTRSPKSIR